MKKGDLVWGLAFVLICAFMLNPSSQKAFVAATSSLPYVMGFFKFAVLATMGELMAIRIITNDWSIPTSVVARAIIWGLLGVAIVLVFKIFAAGVSAAQSSGALPFEGNKFAFAFFTSSTMNLIFAPTMMAFHRFTDTYLDLKAEKGSAVGIREVTDRIDWYGFVSFVLVKTIPFFWIPAHTITFLLPPEFRVLAAAFLSIALGAILAFAKKEKPKAA